MIENLAPGSSQPPLPKPDLLPEQEIRQVKIMTHNVYWFQGHPFSGDQPAGENREIFQRLCALYVKEKVDILCLQEIQSADVAEKVHRALEMNGLYVPGNIHSRYGGLVTVRHGLRLKGQEANKAASLRERSLVVTEISGTGYTLGIANVHLTSGRQSGTGNAGLARSREIGEFLSEGAARTDILVGDFNENSGYTISTALEAAGFVDAAAATGQEAIPASAKGNARTDMIWIKRDLLKSLTGYGVIRDALVVDDLPGKTFLSDHLPVWITLAV